MVDPSRGIDLSMLTKKVRVEPSFLQDSHQTVGKYGFAQIKPCSLTFTAPVELISIADTRPHDLEKNRQKGVHFFVDDYRFQGLAKKPQKPVEKLKQYSFVLTPDFSTYREMPRWRQIESIGHSRSVGSFWQNEGLEVIPTVTWSDAQSYEFCFCGLPQNAIVAVSTLGCLHNRTAFLRGYSAMLEYLSPKQVICFGKTLPSMNHSNIELLHVDYIKSRRGNR